MEESRKLEQTVMQYGIVIDPRSLADLVRKTLVAEQPITLVDGTKTNLGSLAEAAEKVVRKYDADGFDPRTGESCADLAAKVAKNKPGAMYPDEPAYRLKDRYPDLSEAIRMAIRRSALEDEKSEQGKHAHKGQNPKNSFTFRIVAVRETPTGYCHTTDAARALRWPLAEIVLSVYKKKVYLSGFEQALAKVDAEMRANW